MSDTSIEWTEKTWNPTVGCTRCSPGCKNCYAFALHDKRHKAVLSGKAMPPQYARPFTELQLIEDRLADPLHWRTPRRVFVNSVSDLFHEDVPDEFLDRVFAVMALAGRHTYQVLTKRAERMLSYVTTPGRRQLVGAACLPGWTLTFGGQPLFDWPLPCVWLGVSVEDRKRKDRIEHLRATPAAVRFLSCEPLLEALGPLDLDGINWVICGCESLGRKAGRFADGYEAAARSIARQCADAGVAFFHKQMPVNGRVSRDPGEWPGDLRTREYPGTAAHADGPATADGTAAP